MAHRAKSSFSFCYTWTYDVFLSFRGADTRTGFTGHLYKALRDKGIHTFMDDEQIRKGEVLESTLVKSIQDSRIAIIVFSENYAQSTFCLDELVMILECINQQGRFVWPIFYDTDPSIVRHLRESYGEALTKHEERFRHNPEKVQKWKLALSEASNLSGWHFKPGYSSLLLYLLFTVVY